MTVIPRDILWKGIIEDDFEDFLYFFFGEWTDLIDFGREFVFLDKEMQEISQESSDGRKYVDKLVQVYTKSGNIQWFLIHVEVQGYPDKKFAERMFTYYYRILDRYNKPIAAIAILTDESRGFHPDKYERNHFGTSCLYKFNTYKLLEKTPKDFKQHIDNPFSIVMEMAWHGLKQNKLNDDHLAELKIGLLKRLLTHGYEKKKIRSIVSFITKYVNFEKPEKKVKFEEELDIILQNPKPMGIQEAIIEWEKKVAREAAIEETTEIVTEQVIFKMNKNGLSDIQISKILDLPIEKVRKVLEK